MFMPRTTVALVALLVATPALAQETGTEADTTLDTGVETPVGDAEVGVDAEVDGDLDMGAETDADMGADTGVADPLADPLVDDGMTGDMATEPAAEAGIDATAGAAAGLDGAPAIVAPEGYVQADLMAYTAGQLIGTEIFDPEGNSISTVSDIEIDAEGQVSAVVADFGGFIGIGQRSVALAPDQVAFYSDADGNLRLYVTLTREALEAMPEYVPPNG